MDEKMISLCISYPSWGDPERQMLFRIADYYPEEDTMYSVPFDDPEYAGEAKKIGFRLRDAYPYMAELREWEYAADDSDKIYSYLYSRNIYEIVFLPELEAIEYTNASAIRKVLTGGFTLDESVSENLLLVIGQTETHYAVLQCRKKDLRRVNDNVYSFASDIRDMIHAMHYLRALQKNWLQYRAPKWINVVDSLQKYATEQLGLSSGDYSYVAEMIENEFVQSNFRILLEFGIPKSAVQKIQVLFELHRFASKDMTEDKILSVIASQKDFLKKYLSAYEMEIINRAI